LHLPSEFPNAAFNLASLVLPKIVADTNISLYLDPGTAQLYISAPSALTSESDPLFTSSPAGSITQVQIDA